MGVRLRIDRTYLDLDPAASIQITAHNPLFDADGVEAVYSFPFKLPATARNMALFGQANRLDRASNATTYAGAALEIEGVPFESDGVIELDEQAFSADGISVVFRTLAPAVMEDLAEVKLPEILETVTIPAVTDARWIFELTVAPTSAGITYTILVNTIAYSYTTPGSVVNAAVTQSIALALNVAHPGLADAGFYDELVLYSAVANGVSIDVPNLVHLSLASVVTLGEAAQQNLIEYAKDVLDTPAEELSFPYLYWQGFYKKQVPSYLNRVNALVDGNAIENEPGDSDLNWHHTWVPFVRVPYILDRIAAQIPSLLSDFTGWLSDSADAQALLIFNNRSLDQLWYDRYGTGVDKWLNGFQETIDLNRHVPDLTAADFLGKLLSGFALWFRMIGTVMHVRKKRDMLTTAPIDWTHLAEPAWTAQRRRRRGFTFKLLDLKEEDKSRFETYYSTQLQPVVVGEGFTPIELPFSTCFRSSGIIALPAGGALKCSDVNQPGSSDPGGVGDNNYSLRFIFDRGEQVGEDSLAYSQATNDHTNWSAGSVGGLTLDPADDDGIYELHHRGIPQLLTDGQPVTVPMRLSISDIISVRTWTNARRVITLDHGQVVAVIKSVQFKVSAQGLGVALVEFVQEK